jgi:hypothetical protein
MCLFHCEGGGNKRQQKKNRKTGRRLHQGKKNAGTPQLKMQMPRGSYARPQHIVSYFSFLSERQKKTTKQKVVRRA